MQTDVLEDSVIAMKLVTILDNANGKKYSRLQQNDRRVMFQTKNGERWKVFSFISPQTSW